MKKEVLHGVFGKTGRSDREATVKTGVDNR
jgi:hypothetical protein